MKDVSDMDYTYERYKPTAFRLFKETFEPLSLRKKVRYFLACLNDSVVFYMRRGDEAIAYCLLERGGGRYPFLTKNDFVISPYIVRPDLRGQGLGTRLLVDVRERLCRPAGGGIYAMVRKNNEGSIRAMKKAGYQIFAQARNTGLRRRYSLSDSGQADYWVFKADMG